MTTKIITANSKGTYGKFTKRSKEVLQLKTQTAQELIDETE